MQNYGKFRTQKECLEIAKREIGKCSFKGKAHWQQSPIKSYYYESGRGKNKKQTYVAYADFQ